MGVPFGTRAQRQSLIPQRLIACYMNVPQLQSSFNPIPPLPLFPDPPLGDVLDFLIIYKTGEMGETEILIFSSGVGVMVAVG